MHILEYDTEQNTLPFAPLKVLKATNKKICVSLQSQYFIYISTRYFIPLFPLLPVAVWIRKNPIDGDKFDRYAIVLMLSFMAALIISFATKYYAFI